LSAARLTAVIVACCFRAIRAISWRLQPFSRNRQPTSLRLADEFGGVIGLLQMAVRLTGIEEQFGGITGLRRVLELLD
jgi:hypothetical protein